MDQLFCGSVIKRRRRMLSVSYLNEGVPCVNSAMKYVQRSAISSISERSANRLRRYVENFAQDFTGMITLTYPKTWPASPSVWKGHLRAFYERLRRTRYFEEHSSIWVLEFQKRGAPHFHLLMSGWVSKAWVSTSWAEITGGDSSACSRCEQIRNIEAGGKYIGKYLSKSLEDGGASLEGVGRWWGVRSAKIFSTASQRLPTVEAAIVGASPWGVQKVARNVGFAGWTYETPVGWVFFGTESEVDRLWHSLMAASRCVGPGVKAPGASQLRTWLASYAECARLAYRARK